MATTLPTGIDRAPCRAGFSLVELTIVIFIMVTLLAVAAPSFVRHYNAALLNSTARDFGTLCQLARIQAVMRQQPMLLHIDVPGQRFWLSQVGGAVDESTGEALGTHALVVPPRIALVSAELAEPDAAEHSGGTDINVKFYPNGTFESVTVLFRGTTKTELVAATLDSLTGRAMPYEVK